MIVMITRILFWAVVSCLAVAMGVAYAGDAAQHSSATLRDELKRFAGNKVGMIDAYLQLHSRHWDGDASYTYQILSMSDAMLGRYDQAQKEMYRAFGDASTPVPACPDNLGNGSFGQWLAAHAGKFNLVMVNEAHNQPLSRALVYQMLPVMRRLGFSILALEALPDTSTADWINRHGYVLDDAQYGFYLREPIEGEVVRRAKQLGFTLANYDVFSKHRELDEAKNLALILKKHPGQKVFVVAGYDHIRRMDDRMAALLPKTYSKPFLSIDQLGKGNDVMRSVCTLTGQSSANGDVSTLASTRWKPGGRGTDVTVFRTGEYSLERTGRKGSAWLTLGGNRWQYRFNTNKGCGKPGACLVEARNSDESANAVPADRYLALGSKHFVNLYLPDGNFVVTYRDALGVATRATAIRVHEGKRTLIDSSSTFTKTFEGDKESQ